MSISGLHRHVHTHNKSALCIQRAHTHLRSLEFDKLSSFFSHPVSYFLMDYCYVHWCFSVLNVYVKYWILWNWSLLDQSQCFLFWFGFGFLRQGFFIVSMNSLCRPDWPESHRDYQPLPSESEIKDVPCHDWKKKIRAELYCECTTKSLQTHGSLCMVQCHLEKDDVLRTMVAIPITCRNVTRQG